jgi:hypothetical protein
MHEQKISINSSIRRIQGKSNSYQRMDHHHHQTKNVVCIHKEIISSLNQNPNKTGGFD